MFILDKTATLPARRMTQRILVVDDDPGLRELLDGYLRDSGYEVQTVAEGAAMSSSACSAWKWGRTIIWRSHFHRASCWRGSEASCAARATADPMPPRGSALTAGRWIWARTT